MRLSLRLVRSALLVGCLGLLIPTAVATAASLSSFRVEDNAKMFSEKARDAADAKIDAIKTKYNKDVLVETFAKLPDDARKAFDKAEGKDEKRKFWTTFADRRGEDKGVDGVYVLITKEPTHLLVTANKGTLKKAFTVENCKEAESKLVASFKKNQFDEGLLSLVNFVELKLNANVGAAKTQSGGAVGSAVPRNHEKAGGSMFSGIWGMVCVGLVVILGLWLVVGLFRALTGAGSRPVDRPVGAYPQGGPGYGPSGGAGYAGGGGPGYAQPSGGGGGGFMSSLFGGMLGAAAGNYVYDSFFRGSSHGPSGGGWTGGGGGSTYASGPPPAADPADRQMGDTGGGADWSSGGSTAEAPEQGGGASWGGGDDGGGASFGGGDDGGGGDWGGGGGGDGGGGDWGGGGGGDGGGGGADW